MQHRTSKFLISSAARILAALLVVLGLFVTTTPRSAQAASFTVTKMADTNDGVCDGDCSLREAVIAANASPGADTITIPAGTYTLTLAGSDDVGAVGDLDVTGPLTINGAGQGVTVIQAGTNNSNGIDKIFSFNPQGAGAGFAVALSNLTLQFGKNPDTYANGNGFGGCFDFDSGTSGLGTLTMSNVTISDCSTTDADGGAIALFLNSGGAINISNSTIQNNRAGTNGTAASGLGGGIFFGVTNAGKTTNVTLSGVTIANNQALGGAKQGGGLFIFGTGGTYNYQLHGVTITGNSAASDGGGIYSTAPLLIDSAGGPSLISGNSSGRSGGGVWLNHSNQTSTISKVTISGNSAADGGGGIRLDSSASGNVLNLSFSRIVNNTAGSGRGSGLSVNNGTANANDNWWGCSAGPSSAPCDTAKVDPASGGGPAGTGSVNDTSWLRVVTSASTNPLVTNQTSGLIASVNTNSSGADVSANVDLLKGLPVAWSAVGGALTGAQGTIQAGGTASATYTATAALAGNSAAAKVDNDITTSGTNVVALTVNRADTTATITSEAPDPTVPGQSYTVSYSVAGSQGNNPTAPSGSVTVSNGTATCSSTVATGQCTLTSSTPGSLTLTATYGGDPNFNPSPASAGVGHTVGKADTTTAITLDNPDPSNVNQAVTVNYSVSVTAPGTGTPTGNVNVSDGVDTCSGSVAAGTCSITLTTGGSRTLTATYLGDSSFNGSTSAGEPHTVNAPDTIPPDTTITATPTNPSTSTSASFSFSGSDNVGVVGFECSLDGSPYTSCSSPQSYTGLSVGSHTFQVRAVDGAGNVDPTPALYTWTINLPDTTPPDTTITANPPNPSNSSSATFSFSGSDNVGVVGFECSLDGATYTACTSPQTYTGLSDGSHTLQVRAVDGSGNVDLTPALFTWTIDTVAPTVTINQAAGQADPTSGSPIHFTVVFSEVVSGFAGGDVNLSGTAGATTATVTQIAPNDGTTYDVAVSGISSGGTVIASIPAGAATDAAGNSSAASTSTDNTVTFVLNNADLTLTKTHTGNFTQGQSGSYTLTVTNSGGGPTSGTVSVVDTLPAGLTATALSGSGWTCTLATITCTTSSVLAAGSSYPALTLVVSVASNAPASVTNTAAVSGGGEQNTGNDIASDPTTIQPAAVGTTGQIVPTGTTCTQFAGQTAPNLNEVVYAVQWGRIKTVTPSSFMYFSKVTAPASNFTIKISQSNTSGWPNLPLAYNFAWPQVSVYNASCKVIKAGVDVHPSYITFSVKGATPGAAYYVSVRYKADRVLGKSVYKPYPTVPYTFTTKLNNVLLAPNTDSINFRPQ